MKFKETNQSGRIFVIKLEEGDEVVDSLKLFVKEHKIKGGFFTAIGALSKGTLSFYNAEKKTYDNTTYDEDLEVTSLIGNVAWKDGEPIIHPHITLGRGNNSAIAGHCGSPSIVSVAMEFYLVETNKQIDRIYDEKWNLVLLDL